MEELELSFLLEYPALKQSEKDLFGILFAKIRDADADETLVESYLKKLKEKSIAHETALLALDVEEGRKGYTELVDFISTVEVDIPLTEEIEFVTTSLQELLQEEENLPGLDWRLKCLNVSIGPVRKGNAIHIFARVETGKSAMWISEGTYMAQQLPDESPLLIFFNEEGGRDIMYRLYSAMVQVPYSELILNPAKYESDFLAMGGRRIKFIDRPVLHKTEMEKIIKAVNPGLIIIDNTDKVQGFDADRKDITLANIYKWTRELAKSWCPVITVAQADATGHNSMWLNESQMAESKTGKPSELDVIIGIGRTDREGMEYIRHINIPKNKLRGGPETKESYRHGKFDVIIKPELSTYKDIEANY